MNIFNSPNIGRKIANIKRISKQTIIKKTDRQRNHCFFRAQNAASCRSPEEEAEKPVVQFWKKTSL